MPYSFRWDDMRFDLGRGLEPDFSIVELNLITGETREWPSFSQADAAYGLRQGTIGERMRKNFLIDDHKFFHVKSNPPGKARLAKLKQSAEIAYSFNTNHMGRD